MSFGKYYDEIDTLYDSMTEYLGISADDFGEDGDTDDLLDEPVCTLADVEKFSAILESYLDTLASLADDPSDEKILGAVESTVTQINKLNEKCDYELIEPLLGDEIWQLIENAAAEVGLSPESGGIPDNLRDF